MQRSYARYVPRSTKTLVDPAAGAGALIVPVLRRLASTKARIVCVDSDATALKELRDSLGESHVKVNCVNSDFFAWSERSPKRKPVDCVLMNPPFAGRKGELRQVDVGQELGTSDGCRHVPLEAAFVLRAIRLLRPGGKLLAVLPCSVVMANGLQWLREALFRCGAIRYVHELPPRTFSNVESRMYLFVFEKGVAQRKLVLFNHDLKDPERLDISLSTNALPARLDFGYQCAARMSAVLTGSVDVNCQLLKDLASVQRGAIESPVGPASSVHTTDYRSGYWWKDSRHDRRRRGERDRRVKRGDILAKRVGRDCHLSFGRSVGVEGIACSDCVLIVRPRNGRKSTALLFALRCLFALPSAKSLLERGTGASYVTENSLRELYVPVGLADRYPSCFADFSDAIRKRSNRRAEKAVSRVARYLIKAINSKT